MEIGKQYDLTATRFEQTEWGGLIFLTDGNGSEYSVKAWPFQIEEGGPRRSTVKVFVKSWDSTHNRPVLWQDRYALLTETFKEDDRLQRNVKFTVTKIESNNSITLKDEYYGLTHTYPTSTPEKYKVGQIITLYVDSIATAKHGGSAYLKLEEARSRERLQKDSILFTTRDILPAKQHAEVAAKDDFPRESDFVELKSSIVFDPETNQPNIDKQLSKIVKSISAFINGKGGTMYIGVTDDGKRCGIESDLCHLNSGSVEHDRFSGQYRENLDHYELKIRHMIFRRLGAYAGSLVQFEHNTANGKTVVIITIQQGKNVVFYDGELVFQRQGVRIQQLKGHEISNFVLYRNSEELHESLRAAQSQVVVETEEVEPTKESTRTKSKAKSAAKQFESQDDLRNHDLWHTLHLHDNGWSVDNCAPRSFSDPMASINIEQYHSVERYRLLLIYEKSRNVDIVPINKKGQVAEGGDIANSWLNKQGYSCSSSSTPNWSRENTPKLVCAHKRDILAVIYKMGDKTYVKTVLVENFNLHKGFSAGNSIVPNKGCGVTECHIYLIPQRYYEQVYKLNKPINDEGIDVTNPRYQYFVNNLDNILSEEHNVCFL